MHLNHLEIANFRKLKAVRIDIANDVTVFVGANNSGKTSAILALRRFLIENGRRFRIQDFTLSWWREIDKIGEEWYAASQLNEKLETGIERWLALVPTLDIWFEINANEIHYVSSLIPDLSWTGGLLGVRVRFEPADIEKLANEFLATITEANLLKSLVTSQTSLETIAQEGKQSTAEEAPAELEGEQPAQAQLSKGGNAASAQSVSAGTDLVLWPNCLIDFLDKKLGEHFTIKLYALDPTKLSAPKNGQALLQELPVDAVAIEGTALSSLIRINEINAQRGLGEADQGDSSSTSNSDLHKLSNQLRSYYAKHLDPTESPDIKDIEALQVLQSAQSIYDGRLNESFAPAIDEVQDLGYPGVSDPKLKVASQIKTIESLDHEAAVSFVIDHKGVGSASTELRLPEGYNGLGYQNLISMIFRLMSFRDAWMRVGKASLKSDIEFIEPLHLVLVEEPEAHLHAQVQQVFIRKAYDVLRKHKNLGASKEHHTQLIVSTHSSHVAHETSFSQLRYFRRLPAGMAASVPVSTVINLTSAFGDGDTERFVSRYLRSQHADLFFADAAILVEGSAERMLVPAFIRTQFKFLNQCYISILEIGGSHAHLLRPLINHLGLITLIITDLDAGDGSTRKSKPVSRGALQKTNNPTLRDWLPKKESIDDLLNANDAEKILDVDDLYAVRVAYQTPIQATLGTNSAAQEALSNTFEDALAFENLEYFKTLNGTGLVKKFKKIIEGSSTIAEVAKGFSENLKSGGKAAFALDVLYGKDFESLRTPRYIAEGLTWLEKRLNKKQTLVSPNNGSSILPPVSTVAEAAGHADTATALVSPAASVGA
ncbi:MAG: ATP-dependent endonuclease [Tagaea sp. CACIAM 22H2]|nr:ATP-dependent endonuclease [Tagaea sp. CACIAM 22H2]